MIFDLVTITVSIALLTVFTFRKTEIFSSLMRNCIIAGMLITVMQMLFLIGNLEQADSNAIQVSEILVMILIRFRPVLIGALYKLLIMIAEKIFEKKKLNSELSVNGRVQVRDDCAMNQKCKFDFSVLSRREIEVARLAAKGYTNAQIAEALFISGETVKRHMSTIFEKLNISSRKELMLDEKELL